MKHCPKALPLSLPCLGEVIIIRKSHQTALPVFLSEGFCLLRSLCLGILWMHGWWWLGLHKGDISAQISSNFNWFGWWQFLVGGNSAIKKKPVSWPWKAPAFPQNLHFWDCFPLMPFSKGLIHLAVQVSCSTLSLRTGQDFRKHTAHWDLLCCSTSVLWRAPTPSSVALRSASVPAWLWGSWRTVTFRSGSSS